MTSVNVTTQTNTVEVTNNDRTAVVTVPSTSVVTAITQGPQGATGASVSYLSELNDVNVSAKTDGSVLYYDAAASKFLADEINTKITLTDGGNF
jgi:hypothetical protein